MDINLLSFMDHSEILFEFAKIYYYTIDFLFFNIWGWFLIIVLIIFNIAKQIRNHEGNITFYSFFSGLSQVIFLFFTNIGNIIIALAILFFLYGGSRILLDYKSLIDDLKEVKNLQYTLKNLKTERRLIDVKVDQVIENKIPYIELEINYYAYSPANNRDFLVKTTNYRINGRKVYVGFGTLNFEYSKIENGSAYNISFPDKIYSDEVSYEKGVNINDSIDGVSSCYKLSDSDLFLIDEKVYNSQIKNVFDTINDRAKAKKLGIRSFYGEAFALLPNKYKTYSFYSTASGGIIFR